MSTMITIAAVTLAVALLVLAGLACRRAGQRIERILAEEIGPRLPARTGDRPVVGGPTSRRIPTRWPDPSDARRSAASAVPE